MTATAIRCRWVFPIASPPIENGVVTIRDGRIEAVGRSSDLKPHDLGDVALLPALVNAHTHLEFSDLAEPLPAEGDGFASWIRSVIARRRAMAPEQIPQAVERAVTAGLTELQSSGTGVWGEIATEPWSLEPFAAAATSGTIYRELLGLDPANSKALFELAESHVQLRSDRHRFGVSPHAPYTVPVELVAKVCRLSKERGFPIAMHLAETREELELLRDQSGSLVDLMREFGVWHDDLFSPGGRPMDYLRLLAQADRAMVVHGNYLLQDEIEFVASQRDALGVAYCPRTHRYFKHSDYPLEAMLNSGVRVALGTDSRASNPDLQVWRELKTALTEHPSLAPDTLLKMITLNAAWCIGWDDQLGSLEPGKRALFCTFKLNGGNSEPYELLLAADNSPQLFIP